MKAVRPVELVHHGVIEAAGFLIHEAHVGALEARRRALALWEPGARVYRLDSSLLVLLPSATWIEAACALGTPVVRVSEVLIAAPLRKSDIDALRLAKDSVVILRDGAVSTVAISSLPTEDPASWLDINQFKVAAASPLATATPEPARPVEPLPTLRATIASVPPASPEAERFLASLAGKQQEEGQAGGRGRRGWGLVGFLRFFFSAFRRSPQVLPNVAPRLRRVSLIGQLFDWARRGFGRLLMWSRVASLLGRRQAQYLARLMQMLDERDLTDALRHAIPLSALSEPKPLPPAFGVPNPRTDLTVRPAATRARTSILLAPELLGDLRRRYRAAAERLEREGRIDEAAFVLAELLQANQEAISLLERHKQFRLAAEIAEARGVPPGVIVRQWLLANEPGRALAIARTRGAFADAVALLERSNSDMAKSLRLIWADVLALAGDYVGAANVVWKVPEGRRLAAAWLDRAIAAGGVAAARALPRKLLLDENAFNEVQSAVARLLEEETDEAPRVRLALAEALENEDDKPPLKAVARTVIRSVIRDRARGTNSVDTNRVRELVEFCGDDALAADLPAIGQLPKPALLRDRSAILAFDFAATDAGTFPVRDAAELPDGRCVVALGEAGVRILARDGRMIAHIDQPADQLVISDHRDRAIALAKRGDVTRLSRIDLASRMGECWCDAQIMSHARDFDGNVWFVGIWDELLALDTLEAGFKALWHVKPLGEHVQAISRAPKQCSVLSGGFAPGEAWTYELPSLTLRSRNELVNLKTPHMVGVSSDGLVAAVDVPTEFRPDQSSTVRIFRGRQMKQEVGILGLYGVPAWPLLVEGEWVAFMRRTETSVAIYVIHADQGRPCARIGLDGATNVSMRFQGDTLVVADDKGRVLVFDLLYGVLRQNRRV